MDYTFIDTIYKADLKCPEPKFKRIDQAKRLVRKQDYMLAPIFNIEKRHVMTLQVLAKPKAKNPKLTVGFTNFDEIFMNLFTSAFQLKVL